jgi:hypothetical protein
MIRLEFLLEERSMENVLKIILPKILPSGYRLNENYFLHPHSGEIKKGTGDRQTRNYDTSH